MKTRRFALVTVVILISSFVFTSSLVRADDWYQGRQGRWIHEQNAWRFRDRDGDEYRQYGHDWRWSRAPMSRAEVIEWYQGRRGRWLQERNEWLFRDVDGNEYRRHGNGWRWYNGRMHGAEGSAYHNRAPGDNRTYEEFQRDQGR